MHACGRCTNIYRVYVCAYLCVLCACMVWCVCVQVVCVGVCTLRHRSTHPQLSLAHFQLSQQSKQSTSRRVGSSQPHPASLWGPCPEDGTLKFHRCWVPLPGAGEHTEACDCQKPHRFFRQTGLCSQPLIALLSVGLP